MSRKICFLLMIVVLTLTVTVLFGCSVDAQNQGGNDDGGNKNDADHVCLLTQWNEVQPATCTEDGKKQRQCIVCKRYEEATIEKLGHNPTVVVNNFPATCDTYAYRLMKCERCDYKESVTIGDVYANHTYSSSWQITQEATCDTLAKESNECDNCHQVQTRDLQGSMLAHSFPDEWHIDRMPGCGANGLKTKKCINCNKETISEIIPATSEHDLIRTPLVDASCGVVGKNKISCSKCSYTGEEIVPALDHVYDWKHYQSANCVYPEQEFNVCSRCHQTQTRYVGEALGHNFELSITQPTCKVNGEKVQKCTRCQDIQDNTKEIIPQISHSTNGFNLEFEETYGGWIVNGVVYNDLANKVDVEVPAEFKCDTCGNYNIVGIGDGVFSSSDGKQISITMKKITFPVHLQHIGEESFWGCTILETVDGLGQVVDIGANAFNLCEGLQTIDLTSIANNKVGNNAFSGCSPTTVVLGDAMTTIPNFTRSRVESLTIGANISNMGIGNGTDWKNSLTTLTINKTSGYNIFAGTFDGCNNLNKVELYFDANNSYLGYIFGAQTANENKNKVPTTLTNVVVKNAEGTIPANAFLKCDSLIDVEMKDGIGAIGDKAFSGCTMLRDIDIPSTVSSIGQSAFERCICLVDIVVPATVQTIGNNAFAECYRLIEVVNQSRLSLSVGADTNGLIAYYAKQVINNSVQSKLERQNDGWVYYVDGTQKIVVAYFGKNTNIVMNDTVTAINQYAFYCDKGIETFKMSNNVTVIGKYAFAQCTEMSSISLSTSLKTIEENAFNACKSLISFQMPSSISSVGKGIFDGCDRLNNLKIKFLGANIYDTTNTHFGYIFGANSYSDNATKVPHSLKVVELTNGTTIPENAFRDCAGIVQVILPSTLTTIDKNAFNGCASIVQMEFPSTLNKIGSMAFSGCSSLIEVYNRSSIANNKLTNVFYLLSNGNISMYVKNVYSTEGANKLIETDEGMFFYDNNGEYSLMAYKGSEASVVLPEKINGKTYSIGQKAFLNCNHITSITISNGITNFGKSAFEGCTALENVIISSVVEWMKLDFANETANPLYYSASLIADGAVKTDLEILGETIKKYQFAGYDGLNSITINNATTLGTGLFMDCTNLTSVIVPEVTTLEESVFQGCVNLSSINLKKVTQIGDSAFSECSKLQTATFGTLASVGVRAFYGCSALFEIDLSSATTIGEYAFYGCSALFEIDLSSATTIGEYAFYGCSALTGVDLLNANEVAEYTFANCTSLATIENASNIKTIFNNAFANCSNLTEADFSNATLVRENAFANCNKLASISLGSVTKIYDEAFKGCSSLETISLSDKLDSIGTNAFDGCNDALFKKDNNGKTKYLKVGDNQYYALIKETNTEVKSYKINSNVKVVAEGAFSDCVDLAEITIPTSVKNCTGAFDGCPITHMTAPADIGAVGTELEMVVINGGTRIAQGAFKNCSKLTSVTIPEGVTTIGASAFCDCTSLTSIKLPKSVTTIGEYAFYGCSKLGSIEIPDDTNLMYVEASVFLQTKIVATIEGNAEYVGTEANPYLILMNATDKDITSVEIKEGTKIIADRAFTSCKNLIEVIVPSSVKSVGGNAFLLCENLTTIKFEGSDIVLGTGLFNSCKSLTSIYFAGSTSVFKNIVKDNSTWDYNTGEYTVYCANGQQIAKSEF